MKTIPSTKTFAGVLTSFALALTGSTFADELDTWTLRYSQPNGQLNGVTFGGGSFSAVGDGIFLGSHHTAMLNSADGINWDGSILSGAPAAAVAFGNGQFVAVDQGAGAWTSPDAVNWTFHDPSASKSLNGVAFGNGKFVAVGDGGTIRTSLDGISWTARSLPGSRTPDLYGIAYGGGKFVAVGGFPDPDGEFFASFTSTDGVTWVEHSPTSPFFGWLRAVAYQAGTFVAVGYSSQVSPHGAIFTSSDGVSWTLRDSGTDNELRGIASGAGSFVTVGSNGTILSSAIGLVWSSRTSGSTRNLLGIAFGACTFVVVGENQTIVQSAIIPGPPPAISSPVISGDFVTVCWPSPSCGFVLQESASLSSPNWTDVTQIPTDNGITKCVTVPKSQGDKFFRLKRG